MATPTNAPMYYTSISGGDPGTPIMQSSQLAGPATISWAAADTIPWSSTTSGGTSGNGNSGPSSGIGSTESSPPYGSSASGHQQQTGGMVYANQSPAYNYSYPPPAHHQQQQQQFWYAAQPQQTAVSGTTPVMPAGVAVGGGGGTPVAAKVDGKP